MSDLFLNVQQSTILIATICIGVILSEPSGVRYYAWIQATVIVAFFASIIIFFLATFARIWS